MTQIKTPREKKDFIYHLGNVMEQLKSAYLQLMPEQGPTAFKTIWQAIVRNKADANSIEKNCKVSGQMKQMDLILIACAYSAHAGREYYENRREVAWTYLFDAQYYAGAATYAKALASAWPEIKEATMQATVAAAKSEGGKTKNAGWKRVEDEAVRLVTILGERGQRWSTERKMAAFIKSDLWSLVLLEIPEASESQYIRTVSGRLKSRAEDIGIYLKKRKAIP